jgi:hypothetical protein
MNGYMFAMFFIGVCGTLALTAPIDNKPKWVNKLAVAWAVIWTAPPLVVVWINGVFG